MRKTKVKICCISSEEEARIAIEYGAKAIGLVGKMPSGPGIISDDLIRTIAKSVKQPVATFLLTSETKPEDIIAQHKRVNTSTIQLVDKIATEDYAVLRASLSDVHLVQVVHVIDEKSVQEAIEVSEFVDFILLDSGNPKAAIKELGGTGRTHNWALSREIRKAITIPLFLAGGLNNNNVKQAVEMVEPFGVDLCSGVRTNGKLDHQKLHDFFLALNG